MPFDNKDVPDLISKIILFQPEHDYVYPNQLSFQLNPLDNCLICWFICSDFEPPNQDIAWCMARCYSASTMPYLATVFKPDGTTDSSSSRAIGTFDSSTGIFKLPGVQIAPIKAGIKYCLIQFNLGKAVI